MESEFHRDDTSVPHSTWECEPSLINSRPLVIHKNELEREFSTRGQDSHSYSIHPRTSAFTPFHRKGSCSHKLTGQSRLSSFDPQADLQQRPVVLSGGRPFHLTSSYDLVGPHESAQKIQEMNQFSALFPGCQRNENSQCSSIREDGFASLCCQENHGQSDEDYQMDFGRGKHKKVPYLSCPDRKIQEPVLPGQRLGVRLYSQPPEGATSKLCDELQVSPCSDARESYDLRSQEIQEENDEQEREEQEEQLKEFSYKLAPNIANYCTPLSRNEISGSFDKEYGSGVHACVSSINHEETQNAINGTSKRIEDERQPSREYIPTRCQNLCCRDPAPQISRHGNIPKNTDNVKSEIKNRADYMRTYWTQNHQGGTTCLVCFKTLKRSYYMKSHMLIHTGDKPYKCAYCTKTFNQVGNRNAHQRIHTGEKPYTCEYCGKQFIFNSSKHNHMKVHCRTSFHFQ